MDSEMDELTECPRCGGEIYWVTLFEDRPQQDEFAMCSVCTWGED